VLVCAASQSSGVTKELAVPINSIRMVSTSPPNLETNSSGEPPDKEPTVGGMRVRPSWPIVLYGILAASAGLALYAAQAPLIDAWVGRVAAWIFFAFTIGFAAYRGALVAAHRYSPFKAFLQVLIAALFFMLLLFPVAKAPARLAGPHPLLAHREPAVRAMAAKVIGLEKDVSGASALIVLLTDPSPEVRGAAHASLVGLNDGVDLGEAAAWKERFR
jgi:hypothetical protein